MTIEEQITKLGESVEELALCVNSLKEEWFLKKLGRWSPRAIVAHLIGWNRYVIEGSRQIMRGELPFYDIDPGENYRNVNAVLVDVYPSRNRQHLLDELEASTRELQQFLRTLDTAEWSRDYGVRHKGATITVQNTVDDLIEDYTKHLEQIEEWAKEQSLNK